MDKKWSFDTLCDVKKSHNEFKGFTLFISFINELVFCLAMWVIHCILDDLPGRFCNEVSRVARNRFGESFCGSKSWIFFCLQVIFKDIRSLETISNGHNTVKMGESRRKEIINDKSDTISEIMQLLWHITLF